MKRLTLIICSLIAVVNAAFAQPPDTLWTYQYRSPRNNVVTDLIAAPDGGMVLLVEKQRDSINACCTMIIELDSLGHEVWSRIYDDLPMYACKGFVRTDDGGFLIVGGDDVFILRTDSAGVPLWTQQYEIGFLNWYAWDVVKIPGGDFAIITDSNYLVRINSVGDTLWARQYIESIEVAQKELVMTPDGGFIYSFMSLSQPNARSQIGLVKSDGDGMLEWLRLMGTQYPEWPRSIDLTPEGDCIIAGFVDTGTTSGPLFPFCARVAPDGDSLWMRIYDEAEGAFGNVRVHTEDSFILTGSNLNSENHSVFLLMGVDHQGSPIWNTTFSMGERHGGGNVVILDENTFRVAGTFADTLPSLNDVWAAGYTFRTPVSPNRGIASPKNFTLTAYPNPFNSSLNFRLEPVGVGLRELVIYDILGREVWNWEGYANHVRWGGVDARGMMLPSGKYWVILKQNNQQRVVPVVLLK